ncbi:hypothetical protein [Kribbella qitaiheensis]|uniref:hypothetical protein n=1 Tax=Kribbella qitaiheensis TaxID=1544730 RepID=UPI0019D5FA99|nr:hypothetical protein [Kribbella qitaiheensis]
MGGPGGVRRIHLVGLWRVFTGCLDQTGFTGDADNLTDGRDPFSTDALTGPSIA